MSNRSTTSRLSGLRVLIVEDEFLIAYEAERTILEAGAAEVRLASSVDATRVALAETVPFDVVVLDLRLGEDDAAQLYEELAVRAIPFVVASGFSDHVSPPNATGYLPPLLVKPYRPEELIDAILVARATR
jgi:DNA-binding NtrC family response regulator